MSIQDLLKLRNTGGNDTPSLSKELDKFLLLNGNDNDNDSGRATGVHHPSEISGEYCPRNYVLLEMFPEYRNSIKINPTLRKIFDIGHKSHDLFQEYYARAGILYGTYKCVRKCSDCPIKAVRYGFYPDTYCPLDKKDYDGKKDLAKWEYSEVRVRDDEYNIEGHTDGVIVLDGNKYIFEFKTIRSQGFRALIEPLPQHKEQALIYLYTEEKRRHKRVSKYEEMIKNGNTEFEVNLDVESIPYSGVFIQYMNKDTQEVKEFYIPYEKNEVDVFISEKGKYLKYADECLATNKIPPRVCANKTEGKQVYKCRIADKCFEK